jgi:putative chitinase
MFHCEPSKAIPWLNPLRLAAFEFEINTPLRWAAFLAQVSFESNDLQELKENLDYKTPDRLMVIFPHHFKTIDQALPYIHHPKELANLVYANIDGNGPPESGDGFRYCGQGLINLTGKANYQAASLALGMDLVGNPDQLQLPLPACRVSGWYWKKHGLNELADVGDFDRITYRINGGYNGNVQRRIRYNQGLQLFGLKEA